MKLQMPVDRKVITSVGHTIMFSKDEPREVPAAAVQDCLLQGAFVVKGVLEDNQPPKQEDLEVFGPERQTAIRRQMRKMIARNARTDFTGAGKPDVFVMNEELKFKITAQERDSEWDVVRQELAAENDPPKSKDEDVKSEDEENGDADNEDDS